MRVLILALSIISVVTAAGCDKAKEITKGDVTLVKAGTLKEVDPVITIGEALDNWKYGKSAEWEQLKDEKGRRLVLAKVYQDLSFIGKNKDLAQYLEFSFVINADESIDVEGCCGVRKKADGSVNRTCGDSPACIHALKLMYSAIKAK